MVVNVMTMKNGRVYPLVSVHAASIQMIILLQDVSESYRV